MKRDLSFDILRAMCTLWIVGLWHLLSQSKLMIPDNWAFGSPVTNTCLACFVFISGYFLSKYTFESGKDIGIFLKKRFFRFYILFFISAASLFCAGPVLGIHWFTGVKQFVFCILGLSAFCLPPPRTLWFISLLMYLYMTTPFVMYRRSERSLFVIILRAVALVLLPPAVLLVCGAWVDIRLCLYGLIYYTAILLPKSEVGCWKSKRWLIIPALVIWFVCVKLCLAVSSSGVAQNLAKVCLTIVYEQAGVLSLLIASDFLSKALPDIFKRFFTLIAYSSMAMYLFHRQVYAACLTAFGKLSASVNYLLCYIVLLPLAILAGYLIQKLYDIILKRIRLH